MRAVAELEKRAVIYVRVSSARQAEEELPIESQLEQCKRKALELGARVDRVFSDDGISGTTAKRPAFQACIEYCETAAPAYLITWSTSRFARNRVDAGLYKLRLAKAGVDLLFVSMNIDRETEGGWMTEAILEVFDEYFSRQVSRDTKRSMILNAERGHHNGGPPPFGYQTAPAADNPKRKRLVVNEIEAMIVREIFDLRLRGLGAKLIAADLNERNVPNRRGRWSKAKVHWLLANEAVIGRTVFNRKDSKTQKRRPRDQWIVVQSHEPIVPMDVWDRVQSMIRAAVDNMGAGGGSPRSTWLFTGLLYGPDGYAMLVESAKGHSKRYYYYNSYTHNKLKEGSPRRIRADLMDEFLLGVILNRILTPEFLSGVVKDLHDVAGEWARANSKKRRALEGQIDNLTTRNSKLFDLLEASGSDTPNLGDLTKRLRGNNSEIKRLEMELEEVVGEEPPALNVTANDVADLSVALRYIIESESNPAKVRHFLGLIIEKIVLEATSVRIIYRPEVLVKNPEPIPVPSRDNWLPGSTLLGTATLVVRLPARFRKKAA